MNNAVLSMQVPMQQNEDIRAGRDALISNRSRYFTQLDLQSDEQFENMVAMTPMYILYPKIVDGFSGTIFAKSPNLKGIEDLYSEDIKNVDLLGNSINKVSEKVVKSVLEDGFCATMNDYINGSSFIRFIAPKDFVSFRSTNAKGYPEINQFIYKETSEVQNEDNEFESDVVTKYFVLDLVDGVYRTRVFQEDGNEAFQVGEDLYPEMNGSNLDYIPIQIHGVEATNYSIKKSPLQDLSDMNLSIMQRVVDQVYMLHMTALPTPYITGVDGSDEIPTTIGPAKAWHIGNHEAKVGLLEFSGNSARAHQDFIDNLKDIMASTGAQILKKEGVSRETATSVLVRTAAQTSLVTTLVNNVSEQIEKTLRIYFEWGGTDVGDDFEYILNSDFVKVDMEANAQIALVKSWIDGAISHKTLFDKMKEGELIHPNKTFEQELEEIGENPPPFFQLKVQDELSTDEDGRGKAEGKSDPIEGSNLENGNIDNPQASEVV